LYREKLQADGLEVPEMKGGSFSLQGNKMNQEITEQVGVLYIIGAN
jgi:hypothetical protein